MVLHGSDKATSSLHLFGQSIDTTSVGVACIAIAAIVIVVTIRYAVKALELSLKHLRDKQ
ncbi:MAG TPA: hypothetical protein VGC36_02260, partial [Rhizomicrobium sp.]